MEAVLRSVGVDLDGSPAPKQLLRNESRNTSETANTNVPVHNTMAIHTRLAQGSAADLQHLNQRISNGYAIDSHPNITLQGKTPTKRKRVADGGDVEQQTGSFLNSAGNDRRQSRGLMRPPPPPQMIQRDTSIIGHDVNGGFAGRELNGVNVAHPSNHGYGPITPNSHGIESGSIPRVYADRYDILSFPSGVTGDVHISKNGLQFNDMPGFLMRTSPSSSNQVGHRPETVGHMKPHARNPIMFSAQRRLQEPVTPRKVLNSHGVNGLQSVPHSSGNSLGLSGNARSGNSFSPGHSLYRHRQPLGGRHGASPHFSTRQLPNSTSSFDQYLYSSDAYSRPFATSSNNINHQPRPSNGNFFATQDVESLVYRDRCFSAGFYTSAPQQLGNQRTTPPDSGVQARLRRANR